MCPTVVMRGLCGPVAENPLGCPFVGGVEVVDLAWCWRDGCGFVEGFGVVIEPETGVV